MKWACSGQWGQAVWARPAIWTVLLSGAWFLWWAAGCGDTAAECGNGVVEEGEVCDSGGGPGLCTPTCGWAERTQDAQGTASLPSVAVTEAGCIVVGFQLVPEGELDSKAYAVVYGRDGALVAGPEALGTSGQGPEGRVQVAGLSGCGFVAVWERGPEMNRDVFGRVFPEGDFASAPSERQLNSDTSGDRYEPVVARAGENFLVAWTALYFDVDDAAVAGRLVDGDLNAPEPEFVVNTYTAGPQERPAVACGSQKCLVVWQSKCQEYG